MIGAGLGQEVLADRAGELERLPCARLTCGFGLHITLRFTSPQAAIVSRQAWSMRLHRAPQVLLDDAVELAGLAGGQAQRAVGVVAGDPVHLQPLLRRADAARQADAGHEAEGRLHQLLAPLRPQVAVVLQVEAVELGELGVVLGDRPGERRLQPLGDGAAQVGARRLEQLVPAELGHPSNPQ